MSYNDPYARQQPHDQPYDPYYSAANQYVNYNNSYPPTNNTTTSNVAWNEDSGPSTNQFDPNYAPERLSRMGLTEPPKCAHRCVCCAFLLRLTTKRLGIRANSDYGDTQSMETSGQKYVDDSGLKS
jgi:hypothetical protein